MMRQTVSAALAAIFATPPTASAQGQVGVIVCEPVVDRFALRSRFPPTECAKTKEASSQHR